MTPQFPSTWQSFFAQPATPAFAASTARPPFRRVPLVPTGTDMPTARAGSGMPPSQPTLPVDGRPLPPEHSRRFLEVAWLTCQMPEHMREPARENLRQTLDWRAQYCRPLKPPKKLPATTRFGLLGEQLWPKGALTVRRTLKKEVRESVRVVEETQPHLERNHLLAMRGARLGQLCLDLEERGLDALEVLRCELTWLWN